MPTFLYFPVYTPEMQTIAAGWTYSKAAKGDPAPTVIGTKDSALSKGIRRMKDDLKLSAVGATDKLYVITHGVVGSGHTGAHWLGVSVSDSPWSIGGLRSVLTRDKNMKMYLPADMAAHLAAEGLTTSIADLRLYACYTGDNDTVPGTGTTNSYAEKLKAAMQALGYNSVMVTGYFGKAAAGYEKGHRHTFDPSTGIEKRASQTKQQF